MARVLFLDPYHGVSHRTLSTSLRDHSRHDVTLLTLPPRKWKWRMRGAALAFEPLTRALPPPEILVCTDMLNLPEYLGLMRGHLPAHLVVISYFHENQLTYPTQSGDERDIHFGLTNIHTALASDRVVFNSAFHRTEFLAAVEHLIGTMPDHHPEGVPRRIHSRSHVLGPPIDLPAIERPKENLILWNHRWEADKNPESFFRVMRRLDQSGIEFKLMILGERFRQQPVCFEEARRSLAHRIEHWGYLPSRQEYLEQVARCRVIVSTAHHEFFGLAAREAVALGCLPLLPHRVVYPEMVGGRAEYLYDDEDDLLARLTKALTDPRAQCPADLRATIASHTVARVVSRWDEWFDELRPHQVT